MNGLSSNPTGAPSSIKQDNIPGKPDIKPRNPSVDNGTAIVSRSWLRQNATAVTLIVAGIGILGSAVYLFI